MFEDFIDREIGVHGEIVTRANYVLDSCVSCATDAISIRFNVDLLKLLDNNRANDSR